MFGIKEKLKEIMNLYGEKFTDLSKALGISYQSTIKKINGDSDFKLSELRIIKERYNLSPEEVNYIFFD